MAKSGVYYGARVIPGGFGIHVLTFRNNSLETEDINQTPWPTREQALDRAKRSAVCEAEREGLKVIGEIVADARGRRA